MTSEPKAESYDLVITVNHADDTEQEIEVAVHMPFDRLAWAVESALQSNNVTEWTSLVVVIGGPQTAKKPKPSLRLVS